MFREFFCSRSCLTLGVAWFGLVGVVGYSVFLAWVKRESEKGLKRRIQSAPDLRALL